MNLIETLTINSERLPSQTIQALGSKLEAVAESSRRIGELASRSASLIDEYASDIIMVVKAVDSLDDHLPGASVVKKELRRYLTDYCGVSKARISKMITVEAFTKQLTNQQSACLEWYKSLPMSSRYTLTLMDEKGFNKAWAELSQWGAQPVSRDALRQLKEKHPMIEKKFRGETPVENSTPTPAPAPIPEWEELPFKAAVSRCGYSGQEEFMYSLIKNDRLPYVTTVEQAGLWRRAIDEKDLLAVIKQKIQIHPNFKDQLLELLDEGLDVEFLSIEDPISDEPTLPEIAALAPRSDCLFSL